MFKNAVCVARSLFATLLFFVMLLFSGTAKGQSGDVKVHWGVASPVAAKMQLLPSGSNKYSGWGNVAFCLVTVVEGTDEQALAILNKLGYALDFTTYNLKAGNSLLIERGNLYCNPEIMFPTRMKRLKVTAGIGVEWNGYMLLQSDIAWDNSVGTEIEDKRRKLFPFLSAGLYYDLKNSFHVQLFVRQMMAGYFTEKASLFFNKTSLEPDMVLNDKPTFVGFAFSYFFGR